MIDGEKKIVPPPFALSWGSEYIKKLSFNSLNAVPLTIHVEASDRFKIHKFDKNNIEKSVWDGLFRSLSAGHDPINIRLRYGAGNEATERILHRLVTRLKYCKFYLK